MMQNDNKKVMEMANRVFTVMQKRVSAEDVARIRASFELANKAHDGQKRKSGEPYIIQEVRGKW